MTDEFLPALIQPFGDTCRHNATHTPDAVAILHGDTKITWRTFCERATRVANGLLGLSVEPTGHVVVLGRNNVGMFEIAHGAAMVGAIFTPVNWRLAPPELEYILKDCDAEVLFSTAALWDAIAPIKAQLTSLKKVILFDGEAAQDYESWRDAQSDAPIGRVVNPADPVVQIYTSGTTGRPKGAVLAHRYFMEMARFFRDQDNDVFDMYAGEYLLHYMPLFHISGVSHLYYPSIRGAGIIVYHEFEPAEVLRLMSENPVPLLTGVPSMLQLLINHPKMAEADLSRVRQCLYGGATMPLPVRDRLLELVDCKFTQIYGMTESNYVTRLAPADHMGEAPKRASVGRPAPGVELCIMDPEGNPLPAGEVGEIAVRSPSIVEGYWNLPELTRAAFRDGWYMTGDGGYLDEDGYLFLKDRIKDLIISGGENIYPAEIESVLVRHPSVLTVAVIGVPDERWGEVPKAYIQLRPECEFDPQALHVFVGENLGRFKLPKYYEAIADFPMTGSGKIMKYALRSRSNEAAVRI